jgi:hypothetical protein
MKASWAESHGRKNIPKFEVCVEVKAKMFGWMTVFAMISVSAAGTALIGKSISQSAWFASIVFAILFLLGLFSRVLRRKSW